MAFTSLAHHSDIEWLKEAIRLTRNVAVAAAGDRVTRPERTPAE